MYVQGIDPTVASRHGYVSTANPDKADVCIARVAAPSDGFLSGRSTKPIDLTLPAETL
jgi:hypothetical protein